jgi:hypothetical protein
LSLKIDRNSIVSFASGLVQQFASCETVLSPPKYADECLAYSNQRILKNTGITFFQGWGSPTGGNGNGIFAGRLPSG